MTVTHSSGVRSQLLLALSDDDRNALMPHLARIELTCGEVLIEPDQPIAHCWFVDAGIVSILASTRGGRQTEVGIVGCEGMIDVSTILASGISPLRSFVQVTGSAYRMSAATLQAIGAERPAMKGVLLDYAYRFLIQVTQTALANGAYTIAERLARWLLMCQDRIGDEIPLTHDFLALMLNVRRAGVTVAVHTLVAAGFVTTRRGQMTIIDRNGLKDFAGEAYTGR